MAPYGKKAQAAVSAVSRLAEVYDPAGAPRLSSAQVAQARHLPQPLVAKVLTSLSQAGIITGSPGPGGGFALSRPPSEITFYDVATLFDRLEDKVVCPLGTDRCKKYPNCPVHQQLETMRNEMTTYLRQNTFALFQVDCAD
jgi:Rrf2 family protein